MDIVELFKSQADFNRSKLQVNNSEILDLGEEFQEMFKSSVNFYKKGKEEQDWLKEQKLHLSRLFHLDH